MWTLAHVALGRTLITLGIINGGLGLKFSGNTKNGEIVYGVIAGLMWLLWMAVAIGSSVKSKQAGRGKRSEKSLESHGGSEEAMRRS